MIKAWNKDELWIATMFGVCPLLWWRIRKLEQRLDRGLRYLTRDGSNLKWWDSWKALDKERDDLLAYINRAPIAETPR